MKVKVFVTIRCPGCGTLTTASHYRGKDIIQCTSDECSLNDKMYELPEIEIKEIKGD